jgi:hypothetical protein
MFDDYMKSLGSGPLVSPELGDRVRDLWAALNIDPEHEPTCGPCEDSAFSIGLRSGPVRLWVEIELDDEPCSWLLVGLEPYDRGGDCSTIEELVEQLAPYLPMFARRP